MPILGKRTDWAIASGDSYATRDTGARPGSAGTQHLLAVLDDGSPGDANFSAAVAGLAATFADTDAFTEVWIRPTAIAFGEEYTGYAVARLQAGATAYYAAGIYWSENANQPAVVVHRVESARPAAQVLAELPLGMPLDPGWIGVRIAVHDGPGAPRVQAEYNVNNSSWILFCDVVDVGDSLIFGNDGIWGLIGIRGAGNGTGTALKFDDYIADVTPAPVDPPVLTAPFTEDFDDGSWA